MGSSDLRTDPDAPLPGPPDPWAETDMPSPRDGPPWHMTEMIEAEPALAVRVLERLAADGSAARLATAVREGAATGHAVVTVGCGTSEHGAMAVAAILGAALAGGGGTRTLQAFEASLAPGVARGDLVIGISHEGATWATMRALEAARAAGATTALVTVSGRSPAAALADIVLETHELDRSWCHTVGYLSPILAAAAVATELGRPTASGDARALLAAGLADAPVRTTEGIAGALAGCDRVVVVGGGVDRIAARELVLKIEEGTHMPAAMRDVETLLHGHLAGMDDRTGVVAIAADPSEPAARARRLGQALRAVRELRSPAAALLTAAYADAIPPELTPAGRVAVADPGDAGAAAALIATAVPLQLLTERLARERGVNPDPIRRDDPRYLRAAEAASPEG